MLVAEWIETIFYITQACIWNSYKKREPTDQVTVQPLLQLGNPASYHSAYSNMVSGGGWR